MTRTAADLDELRSSVARPDAIRPIVIDVADKDAVATEIGGAGDIDLVVNNAGIALLTPFLETDPNDFDQVMAINLRAAMMVSQIAARNMVARGVGGAIVNVSSQGSMVGLKDHAAYCASKGGLDQLTRVMAVELGPHGIRTNCVNPTVVLTAMGRLAWSDPEVAGPMLSRIPVGRFAETHDVVSAIIFLLSDKAQMCNGTMLPVEGGFLST